MVLAILLSKGMLVLQDFSIFPNFLTSSGSFIPWMSLYFTFFLNQDRISGKAKMITQCFNSSMGAKHYAWIHLYSFPVLSYLHVQVWRKKVLGYTSSHFILSTGINRSYCLTDITQLQRDYRSSENPESYIWTFGILSCDG